MSCIYCNPKFLKRRDLIDLERLGSCFDGYLSAYILNTGTGGDESLVVDISEDDVSHFVRKRINFCPMCGRDLRKEES